LLLPTHRIILQNGENALVIKKTRKEISN